MSKTITFESKVWPGSVVLSSPMTLEQEASWEYAVAASRHADNRRAGFSASLLALLPGFYACVEKWDLQGFPERITPQNFPTRPRAERARLVEWLVANIGEIYNADINVPNE